MSMGEQEFEEAYTQHRRRVFQVCYRVLRDRAEAEDATQEVFMRLLTHHDQFEGRSLLATWLYRIAVNIALMRLRNPWIRKFDPLDVVHDDKRIDPNLARVLYVREGLAKISLQDQDILHLSCEEGFTVKEMAAIHRITLPAVKGRLFRARRNLAAVLM